MAKTSTKHPYAAIQHRVTDSPAYADLSFSAQALLLLIARQLTKDNNGHMQCTYTYMHRFGFNSEHTLRNAIANLISHGFIYRTRSHGANKAWAKYCVTWLPIKNRKGLFLDAFQSCAWRYWTPPTAKKSSRHKMPEPSGIKCSFTTEEPAKSAGTTPAKSAEYELIPCRGDLSEHMKYGIEASNILRLPLIANGRLHQINQHFA